MKIFAIAICLLATLVATAFLSARFTADRDLAAFDTELRATQVSIWVDHLNALDGMQVDLEKGCNTVALEKIKNAADEEMLLLSEALRKNQDESLSSYANKLQPGVVERVANFHSRHGNSWDVPTCEQPSNNSFKGKPLRGSP